MSINGEQSPIEVKKIEGIREIKSKFVELFKITKFICTS